MNVLTFFLILLLPLYQVIGQEYSIRVSRDSSLVTLQPDNFNLGETVALKILKDLNHDGLDDMILNFQMCNSMGDCMYGVFVQQKNGKFVCVYQPEYWSYFEIVPAASTSSSFEDWKEIVVYERTGKLDDNNKEAVKSYSLKYDGEFYVPSIK